MNVLVDRHHAGLLNSLQLLLEDRLGYTVYVPIGHDWWDTGYWQFGAVWGDDRLAQQYLVNQSTRMYDPEFPERLIRGVTFEQAQDMTWGVVMATVQENQPGFARFAREKGARYAVHVGNTGQYIDWSLSPLVVNASEMPMLGEHANIGEEFDSEITFAQAALPLDRAKIGSFIHAMPLYECWPLLQRAQELMPEYRFVIHGDQTPNGRVMPTWKMAEIMRSCGWGWHDKAVGDGYGHVLHYWAAIGRPLIGHAGHYTGKTGLDLWEDGVTCVDLGRRSLENAVEMIRQMPLEQHAQMCREMRARFDASTDWEGDARRVSDLLSVGVPA